MSVKSLPLSAPVPTAPGSGKGSFAFVSLGCPKNTVDSERMLGKLATEGYALRPDASGADVVVVNTCGFIESARQESLAAALRDVRKSARPGDLVPAAVADLIRTAVAHDLKRRSAAATRGALEEVPNGPPPVINKTYPVQAALPTVPPLLLTDLPPLPDNLQYRFYDRHMVILDGDVEIIVDYIANVLPAH